MQWMDCYCEVFVQMFEKGFVYLCYMLVEEFDVLCECQCEVGLKLCYDGMWCLEFGKVLLELLVGVKLVLCFCNLLMGMVVWDDVVKGCVEILNEEFDDFVIVCLDGMLIYNFCVVVDDMDMGIMYVICGDDYVNNMLCQINILNVFGGELFVYVYLLIVLNEQGEKMSKWYGVMSVMVYCDVGFLLEVVVNYFVCFGWLYGDVEIFLCEQFVEWFDFEYFGKLFVQYDYSKLSWLNVYYIKEVDNVCFVEFVKLFFDVFGIDDVVIVMGFVFDVVVGLMKDCVMMVKEIVEGVMMFYCVLVFEVDVFVQYVIDVVCLVLVDFVVVLKVVDWMKEVVFVVLKVMFVVYKLKMLQFVMLVCLLVVGMMYMLLIDVVFVLFGCDVVVLCIEVVLV